MTGFSAVVLLEDHREMASPVAPELLLGQGKQLRAPVADRPARDGTARKQPHRRERGCGLAAPGLARDAEDRARAQRQVDAPKRGGPRRAGAEFNLEPADPQHLLAGLRRCLGQRLTLASAPVHDLHSLHL